MGRLRELVLHEGIIALPLPKHAMARSLARSLRCLHVCVLAQQEWFENVLQVEARLQAFTALQDLRLTAYHLELGQGVRLPPSLTSLALGREVTPDMELGVALPQLVSCVWALSN